MTFHKKGKKSTLQKRHLSQIAFQETSKSLDCLSFILQQRNYKNSILTFIEYLICARHYTKQFIYIIMFKKAYKLIERD